MRNSHQRHLLTQLRGGLLLWQGLPWWVPLPESLKVPSPNVLARWALDGGCDRPREVASWLGCQEAYPLDASALRRWKGRLVGAGLSADLLPNIEKLLADGNELPSWFELPHLRGEALKVWSRLAPLLGVERAGEAFRFLHWGWSLESSRGGDREDLFLRLRELFTQDWVLRNDWYGWEPEQRLELFESWMGGRPERREAMQVAAAATAWSEGLDRLYKAWQAPILEPTYYLALGLCFPGARLTPNLKSTDVRELLGSQYSVHSLDRFQMMLESIGQGLSGYLLAHTKLDPDALRFVGENELADVLEDSEGWGRSERRFLRLCRKLIDAGIESRWLNDTTLRRRAGRLEAFVYLLLLDFEEPPSQRQAEALDDLTPIAKLSSELFAHPEFPPDGRDDWACLCRDFDLSPADLEQCSRWRLTLGHPLFPKRLLAWAPSRLAQEERHLRQALATSPDDSSLAKRLALLQARRPDEREIKRVREELERAHQELPKQLWERAKPLVLQRLLSSLVGSEVAQSAPRVGLLLRQDVLPISTLARLREHHPENDAWLERFETAGFSAAHWLDDWSTDFQVDGRHIDLVAETDPAEILEMGSHFQTCLSLDGGFNAFSVLTNILEVNKKVLIGRDVEGNVVLRKLIGITLKGELVGYHTYSHWPGVRPYLHRACARYAEQHGYRLSNQAAPESIIKGLSWYDDGAEAWETLEVPSDLPTDWPRDIQALQQWQTLQLIRGEALESWAPTRPAEFYWALITGRVPKGHSEDESWRYQEAVGLLALSGRLDRLADPRLPLSGYGVLRVLAVFGGFDAKEAREYAQLLNPEHRVYRTIPQLELADCFEWHRLAPNLLCLSPGELRRTCERLLRAVRPKPWSQLFQSMADLVTWAYHLAPEDPAWRHFDASVADVLMLEVATRQAMPCWRDALVSWNRSRSEWESRCGYARAHFEGAKLLPELEERLSRRREDIFAALAVVIAGGDASDYLLPEPEKLLDLEFLVDARPLGELLGRRLKRLEEKGGFADRLPAALRRLQHHPLERWASWPKGYRDEALDRDLTPKILRGEEAHARAAWVLLGSAGSRVQRLGALKALDLKILPEQQKRLREKTSFDSSNPREELLRLWLGGEMTSLGPYDGGGLHLALVRWPEIFGPALERTEAKDRLAYLAVGAEVVSPEVLKAHLERFLGKGRLSAEEASVYLASEGDSVIFQQEILKRPFYGDFESLERSERGRWARTVLDL